MEKRKYDGFAEVIKHAFTGNKPHELSIVMTNGLIGDFRRFAMQNMAEAIAKCAEFNVKLKG